MPFSIHELHSFIKLEDILSTVEYAIFVPFKTAKPSDTITPPSIRTSSCRYKKVLLSVSLPRIAVLYRFKNFVSNCIYKQFCIIHKLYQHVLNYAVLIVAQTGALFINCAHKMHFL